VPTQLNPFEAIVKGTSYECYLQKSYDNVLPLGPTQAAVRRQLAEDEAKDLAAGKDFTLDNKVSPSVLIAAGLDLEAEQYTTIICDNLRC
jgi:hypothetical protein